MKTKKYILVALSLCFFGIANAQQNLELKINHMLGSQAFSMETTAANSLGDDFKVSRLEYYISDIEIKNGAGEYIAVEDTWLLVRPEEDANASFSLGTIDEEMTVEGIRFHIGVGPDVNHEDPSLYEASHPLAPKSPSMHWGWASGYRFVAIEGKSGADLISTFEFHALGDDNYFQTEATSSVETTDDMTTIRINANYEDALVGIDMSSGVVIHGDYGDAERLLKNFRDYVFMNSEGVGVAENDTEAQITIYPSHATDGYFNVSNSGDHLASIEVYNYAGQLVKQQDGTQNFIRIEQKGVYTVLLLDSFGKHIATNRLTVL